MKKVQFSQNLSLKHELKTQNYISKKMTKNSKINSGVIFIKDNNNSGGNCSNSQYKRKEERTYWFHKYLQDLQNRGISQKIVRKF